MKNLFIGLGIGIVVVIGIAIFLSTNNTGTLGAEIPMTATATNSSSTVGTSAVLVFTNNSGVSFRAVTNIGTTTIFLSFNSTSTGFVANTGYALLPSSTLELSESKGNLWRANIYGISSVVGQKLSTIEVK